MLRFTLPRDIFYGRGSLEALRRLEGKRAMIVMGGGSLKRAGVLKKVQDILADEGFEVALLDNVEPDPSVETVLRGGQAMTKFAPDWIIAMGGGSAMDAAKAMWVFYEHPQTDFKSLCVPFSFPKLRQKAKFAAIPSTSGTASEVTAFSVITDNKAGIKYPLADFEITPDVAILDPDLVDTMPPKLRAHTGLDALTHAMEAYVSTLHSPFTDPLALQAIDMVFVHLPDSFKGDLYAAEQMHYAQCLAGMAFSNALLGIVHSLAHKTGAAFETGHIPHGLANAIYLPYVIAFNAKDEQALARYGQIATALGALGDDNLQLTKALIKRIEKLREVLEVPSCLARCGVDEKEFLQKLPRVAADAVDDACTGSNPRQINVEQMQELLKCIYYGEPVVF